MRKQHLSMLEVQPPWSSFSLLITMYAFARQILSLWLLADMTEAFNSSQVVKSHSGMTATAKFPDVGTASTIAGDIRFATRGENEQGLDVYVRLQDLPLEAGPFAYHVHEFPVTGDNCSSTGAHLDPFLRGESSVCDSTQAATCQVGDLSGKHGKLEGVSVNTTYTDSFLRIQRNSSSSIVGRSITIHAANK